MDIRQLSLIAKNAGLRLLAWNQQGPGGALPLSEILAHTHEDYAPVAHTHEDYAPVAHTHEDYAPVAHTHEDYAPVSHYHADYAPVAHTHEDYAPVSHYHADYAPVAHTHEDYAPVSHDHAEFLTQAEIEALPGFGGGGGGAIVGEIRMWPFAIAPAGWRICDGSGVGVSTPLYALGVTVTPDFRGRFPVGCSSSYSLGSVGGVASVTLTQQQMPSHAGHSGTAIGWTAGGNYNVLGNFNKGNGEAHTNIPPYLSINFIIYEGV